ncbi:MAG: lipocalin-like domain-containing protein [Bacteroidaceae bacterium]|nr:lipocalin-like domain-containing protein [Bacteroidaceae bacterium]
MRRFIVIATMIVLVTACQKADHNGELGGFWQLLEIERNDTALSAKEDKIFWSIQLDLIQISGRYGRFQHMGDSLFIQMIDTKENELVREGIDNATDERFAVELLNRKAMRLRSKETRLTFRKF